MLCTEDVNCTFVVEVT